MGHEVWIYTNEKRPKYIYGSTSLYIDVVELKPYDGLSKRFKKYTHTIQYTSLGDYKKSDYYFYIYNPNGGYYSKYILRYKHPFYKLNSVDIFFKNYDSNNNVPLILGFNHQSQVTLYFTCKHLCHLTNGWFGYYENSSFLLDGSFKESDLLTRLLEEIGPSVRRERKLVINLNQKPTGKEVKYPDSGHFKGNKITVTKEDTKDVQGFEKYVHTIDGSIRVEQFYVSYNNDSMYFENADRSGYLLESVTVYRENTGSKKPVLFELTFRSKGTSQYTYFDFVTDLKKLKTRPSEAKQIKELTLKTSDLQSTLEAERERLKQLITFVMDDGLKNENVSTQGPDNVGEGKFKKVTMRPNTDDAKEGSSVGPWRVYNTKLLTKEPSIKIQPSTLLDDITTGDTGRIENSGKKYSSITVFYTSENKALLVEFDQVGGTKTYFRRKNKEGNTWAKETGISSGGVDAGKLNNIRTEAGVTTTRGTSSIQPGNGSRDAKRIDIYTNKTGTYSGDAKINVNLTEEQWDPLSKVFKVYKHAIQYPGGGSSGYNPSDYNIRVTGPGESGSQFGYTWPTKKVTEVEVFFKGTASPGNTDPLVVGFVYGDDVVHGSEDCKKSNSSKCYYSWSQLKDKDSTNAITNVDSVIEKDLVTVLLEMIGTSHNRQDKLVIRLGEQPASSSSNYPGTGKNKNEITVKKQFVSGDSRFVKYEHTFTGVTVNGVEGFYVSYEKNSRFIMTGLESMSGQVTLEKVAVYYKAAGASPGGTDKPLLIVFHFKGVVGTYEYRYSEFNEELQGLSGGSNWLGDTKIIGELTSTNAGGRSDSELISILQQESGSGSQGDSTAATVGGAVGGVAGVGGIAGIAIYKNFAAVTGLIGRLF